MNIEYAYLAGIIDGEGSILLSKNNKSDKFRKPVISVTSTSEELILYLKFTFGGNIVNQKIYKDHHKKSWIWKLRNKAAINLLSSILPFMKEKEKIRRAKLLCEIYPLLTIRNGKYSSKQIEDKLQFEHMFSHPSIPYQKG
jgi:intein/homing endonuclease